MHRAYLTKTNISGDEIFYSLHLCQDLFSGWTVIREWGRVGQEGRVTLSLVPNEQSARSAVISTVSNKTRNGYLLIDPKMAMEDEVS